MDAPTTRSTSASSSVASQGGASPTGSAGRAPGEGGRVSPTVPFASLLALARKSGGSTVGAKHMGEGRPLTGGRRPLHGLTAGAATEGEARIDGPLRARKQGGAEDATEGGSLGASDEDAESASARTKRGMADDLDPLDPAARHAAHLAPPVTSSTRVTEASSAAANEPVRARSLEELLPALVRRIAWAGDRHKGTVRLELGAGAYAGTTVTVHADAGRVRVELGGCEGPELDRLRARLDARLRRHGLDVESVT